MIQGKYVDVHSHIMPGVDDGAEDLDMSVAMLKRAAKEGIGTIILTPHQKPEHKCVTRIGIEKRISLLQEELEKQDIPIRLYPGAELFYCRDMRKLLEEGRVCTLAGSRYVLVEFMPEESWDYIRDGIYDLAGNYRPILAHVERYSQVIEKKERVRELIEMGAYIQMNAGSITGDWGYAVRRNCMRLLKQQMVHFIGTDAHRAEGKRAPRMKSCGVFLEKQFGRTYSKKLLCKNAEKILADKEL